MLKKLVFPISIFGTIFAGWPLDLPMTTTEVPRSSQPNSDGTPHTPRPCKSNAEGVCDKISRQVDVALWGHKVRFCAEVKANHYDRYYVEDIDLEHRAERAIAEALDTCRGGPDVSSICAILSFLRTRNFTINHRYLDACRPVLDSHTEVCSNLSHYCMSATISSRFGRGLVGTNGMMQYV